MPHSDHSLSPSRDTFANLPPFPSNIPTAPLLRISLSKLLQHDPQEEERCWKACCDLGFFYLDLGSDAVLDDANALFEIMKSFFDLEVSEKVKYDFKDQGSYFGYKGYGEGIVDKEGTRDRNEFYNVRVPHLALPLLLPANLCRYPRTTSSTSRHLSPHPRTLPSTVHSSNHTSAARTPYARSSPPFSPRASPSHNQPAQTAA